jgi:septum formation protein
MTDQRNRILLASRSPRRKKILEFLGIPFKVVLPVGVSEKQKLNESAMKLVRRLAIEKALRVARKYPRMDVLAADTVVVCAKKIYGKPRNRQEALKMLMKLQGNTHFVWTGAAWARKGGAQLFSHVEKTKVIFNKIDADELKVYLDSSEPYDKAGGYDIQGTVCRWIKGWEGDYFNVMGLPVQWVLRKVGERSKD